jgi:hypothetical protein
MREQAAIPDPGFAAEGSRPGTGLFSLYPAGSQVGGQYSPSWYWSGTEYANNPNNAWNFNTNNGNQNVNNKDNNNYALAVRPGE